jgi:hypothetical protein
MALVFLVFVAFYTFAAPNVLFSWYGAAPSLMFYPLVMLGLWRVVKALSYRISQDGTTLSRPFWGAVCAVLTLGLLAGLVVRSQNLKVANQWQRDTLEAIGVDFDESAPDATVMLEPIGYVGFFSDRYVYDLAGLVSPAITDLRRRYPQDWYARAIFSFSPQYLVLRKFEIEDNVCFLDGGKLFQSQEQRARFFGAYRKVKEFSGMAAQTKGTNRTQFLTVFERTGTTREEANH